MGEKDFRTDSQGAGRQVAKATGTVGLMTLLSRVLGLVRDQVTANYFGAGLVADAFFVAFKIPNLLRRLVAEGSLATAFVPVFTDELHVSEDRARRAAASVTSMSVLLTVVLTVLGMVWAEEITAVFAPGWAGEPEKMALAASLMQLMFPYIVLVCLLALATSILNCLGHFALPAAWPAILNVTIIASVVLLSQRLQQPIFSMAGAVLAGGVVALLPQLMLLRRLGMGLCFGSPFRSEPVRKLTRLMIPSVLSASVYQIMIFINTSLASMLKEGSVSWLYYADRMFQFPLGVFSIALATAVLPTLSRYAANNDRAGLEKQLKLTLGWVSFITIPASLGLMVLSLPIIEVLFGYGRFALVAENAPNTAQALCAYSVGLWAISTQIILVRSYLAKKNSSLPAMVSISTVLINILFAFLFMGAPEIEPTSALAKLIASIQAPLGWLDLGHLGLALSGSLAAFFAMLALFALANRVQITPDLSAFLKGAFRAFAASLVMAGALFALTANIESDFLVLALGVPLGALVYFAVSLLFKSPEARQVLKLGRERCSG